LTICFKLNTQFNDDFAQYSGAALIF